VTRKRLAFVALAISLLASGCGEHSRKTHQQVRSAKGDVKWLRTYGLWAGRLRTDFRAAERERNTILTSGSTHTADFAARVNRLGTCAKRYLRNVGRPPNLAWRRPSAMALAACRGYVSGERKLLAVSRGGGGRGDLLFAGQSALDLANEKLFLLDSLFEHTFLWNRRLPRSGGVSGRSRTEPLFSRIATPIARRPVEIHCWSAGEWKRVLAEFRAFTARGSDPAGFVDNIALSNAANLGPWTCRLLDRLAYRHFYPRSGGEFEDMADAVQILSHEIQHLVAAGSEAETECYGMQALEKVARGLGVPKTYARALAVEFWKYWYPADDLQYHTERCHDGGPLDAHPSSSRWP
jgi:hypothetical protein